MPGKNGFQGPTAAPHAMEEEQTELLSTAMEDLLHILGQNPEKLGLSWTKQDIWSLYIVL